MALKPDRYEADTDISFFMNEVAEAGVIVCVSTGGSGAAMDDAAAMATVKASASGALPLGVLLNDVVNVDLSRYHLNQYKDEVQIGSKVTNMPKGVVVTNRIVGTPTAGAIAYLSQSGNVSATNEGGTQFTAPIVGRFLSVKDEDGYAKVSINLP
jgi:hypothetical protein